MVFKLFLVIYVFYLLCKKEEPKITTNNLHTTETSSISEKNIKSTSTIDGKKERGIIPNEFARTGMTNPVSWVRNKLFKLKEWWVENCPCSSSWQDL